MQLTLRVRPWKEDSRSARARDLPAVSAKLFHLQPTSEHRMAEKPTPGGETHQSTNRRKESLTTNQGIVVSDNQNSLKAGVRGPTLLEDFVLREKITHFDHERIPERVVHARGYGARGFFEPSQSHADLTAAEFLQDPTVPTPVFVRFSTVAGSAGSADTVRDVRGFAIKFYTSAGNYDLVANNIPVFFIQDAIKFPDLIHAVKPAPDRAFPQAQSAHDSFWDFASLTPESTHMLFWAMSDRGIPRSFRMMDGFGVHTFRMINAKGKVSLVKFHLRPKLGTLSLVWEEAVCLAGADPDFHRRDLWNSIARGDFPEWELSVQAFTEAEAEQFDFDVLDPTKIVPEEVVPLRPLGRLVLNENVDNFFAETEQIAFCPANIVPGIDLSDDPLLQGRLFSYLDTQLSRLGSPNFHQIPVNRARCPVANFQRDGQMQMNVPVGQVAHEPNSLDAGAPRENPRSGFRTSPQPVQGEKVRVRSETFADHYSQARMFYRSLLPMEQQHLIAAFAFELGKCREPAVRKRMLGRLALVEAEVAEQVAAKLGMTSAIEPLEAAVPARDLPLSPAVSQYSSAPLGLAGKTIGLLVTDGIDAELYGSLLEKAAAEQARVSVIALTIGDVMTSQEEIITPEHFLSGAPSALFDAIVVAPSTNNASLLLEYPPAAQWVRDAFNHLKVIGILDAAQELLERAGAPATGAGLVPIRDATDWETFLYVAGSSHRVWEREVTRM
jgi:catalase